MKLTYALAGLLVGAFATPVLADYWVVQDPTTKKCTVTKEKPPETTAATILINTEEEATDYIKRTTDCNRS